MCSPAFVFDARAGKFPCLLKHSRFVFYSCLNVQAVDHPYLVVYSQSSSSRSAVMANNATTVEQICGICHEPIEDLVVSFCFY